jgi:hypothetical protein
MKQTHIIIKELILQNGQKQNIVLLNNAEEIWEFKDFEEAERIAQAFEKNSDSGWKYKVKSIKSI